MAGITFTLYFLLHGLSQAEIATLFSIFMISLALLEIPTGGYADTFGHKKSVVLGLFLESFYFLILFFSTNFYGFAFGMIIAALGIAFQSGAINSLIYEILEKENRGDDFAKVQGKIQSISLITMVIAAPIGTFLYKNNPQTPYFLAFVFTFLTAICAALIKYEFTKKSRSVSVYLHNIKTGIQLTMKNNLLLGLIIIGISLTLSRLLFNQNISQPYFLTIGIDVAAIGIVVAIESILMAILSFYSHKILEKLGEAKSLILLIFIPSLCTIILSQLNYILALVFVFTFAMSHALRVPILGTLSQKELTKEQRSTMASTGSFISSITVGILLPWWGLLIDKFGISTTLLLLGCYTIFIGFTGFYIIKLHKKDIKIITK